MLVISHAAGLFPPTTPDLTRRAVLGGAAAALTGAARPAKAATPSKGTVSSLGGGAAENLLIDPSATLLDTSKEYDMTRSLLYDTHSGSFLPPVPQRFVGAALQRCEQCAAGAGSSGEGEPRVLFAAEEHTNPLHHRMQLELIKAVDSMDERPLAIGLEMFYRQHQQALDAFVFEDGSFSALKRRTQWQATWGYDFNQYSKILAYARQRGIQLIGLNVPFGLVNAVANVGLDGLPPKMKEYVPAIDKGQRRHFERFEKDLYEVASAEGTRVDAASLQKYYEAELLWDEYMAESIAEFVTRTDAQPETAGARLVVLAGASHVRARDGVPDRVSRRTGGRTFTMLPLAVPWAATGMPAIQRPLGPSEADWLLYTQSEIEHPRQRRFGPRVLQQKPRVSGEALRLGTSAAPIVDA